jgi:hypothetical protein
MLHIKSLSNHVINLAKGLGCKIIQTPGQHGMMYVEFGYVEGPIIKKQADYLVNLHELGHFALKHTQGRPPKDSQRFYFDNGVLHSEAQAWEWAIDRSLEPLFPATRKFIWEKCLGSYLRCAKIAAGKPSRLINGNRHWVEFVYDEPDAYFYSIVKRIAS